MKKNNFFSMKSIVKKIVFIDGITRAGKLLSGALVSSLKDMESIEFGENFEHFLPALKLKKCSYDFARSYLSNYINQLMYNKMISRNVNFRPTDRTGINNYFNPKIYKNRLKMNDGDIVLKRLKKLKPILPFVTHDLMTNYEIFSKLNINVKTIEIFRNPIDLVYSWCKKGLGNRWGKDPRMFTLLVEKNKKPYPWYLYDFPKKWTKLNTCEKCIYLVNLLTTKSIKELNKIKNKKKFHITTYEKIITDTQNEMIKISNFLNTKFSNKTLNIIKKEKCPKKINIKNYQKKLEFVKKNTNKFFFNHLMLLAKKYNKNTYGLIVK